MPTNTYERRSGPSTHDVQLDKPTSNVDLGKGVATGIALEDASGIQAEAPTRQVAKALAEEAFMAEELEVMIFEPADADNEPNFVEVGVNGQLAVYPRNGQPHRMRRYHLAQILGAKQQKVQQKKVTLRDGEMAYETKTVLQPLYPVQIIHDPNPAGAAWARQLMQAA